MQTVVELPSYIKQVSRLLPAESSIALVLFLAANPEAGEIMEGTGGVRKVRWARPGRGKSAGVRVIYYVYNESMPLFLLTVFGKNEKMNLSDAEKMN